MLFHQETKTIVYPLHVELPEAVARETHGKWQLVKASYGNMLLLAGAGCEVPDPMASYDWPSPPGETPALGQMDTARHMVLHPRSFVFSDMRTGKTRAALWACDWLMSRSRTRIRTLVVSDIMALTKTWGLETIRCLLGRRTYTVLHGTALQREKALAEDVDFYFINHDGLKVGHNKVEDRCVGLAKALLKRDDIKVLVLDEAATYRNRGTLNFHAAFKASKRAAYVWAMTGTPTPNGPLDAYGVKKMVQPAYSEPYLSWRDRSTIARGPFRREPHPNAAQAVADLLSPAIRISQEEVFTPTECKVETVHAPLSTQQRNYMHKLQSELLLMLDDGPEISAVNQAALRAKLIQIACGVIYDEQHESHSIDAKPRLDLLDKVIAEAEGKIIIFSPLINTVNMIHSHLGSRSLRISAGQTRKEKLEVLKEFADGAGDGVVCCLNSHPAPIARGIDLTVANTIVWYAPTDRTEYYLQANQRINGPAQKKPRRIVRLSGSAIENDIYDRLENNETMQGAILKLKEMRI